MGLTIQPGLPVAQQEPDWVGLGKVVHSRRAVSADANDPSWIDTNDLGSPFTIDKNKNYLFVGMDDSTAGISIPALLLIAFLKAQTSFPNFGPPPGAPGLILDVGGGPIQIAGINAFSRAFPPHGIGGAGGGTFPNDFITVAPIFDPSFSMTIGIDSAGVIRSQWNGNGSGREVFMGVIEV